MSEGTWRPLGVDTDDQAARYDALHDGVPDWMSAPYWAWVRQSLTTQRRVWSQVAGAPRRTVIGLDCELAEAMCQSLQLPLPDFDRGAIPPVTGERQLTAALEALKRHPSPLQIADYLLAHEGHAGGSDLDAILTRSKSAFTVGTRAGRSGLARRVPEGVQLAADSVMTSSARAGSRLAQAWEKLYGVDPDASAAYSLAIKAVEDAAVPLVSPTDRSATLGKVLAKLDQQGNWQLPMQRQDDRAPSSKVLIGMVRLLWHGQHDRHGGQPPAPDDVSIAEATVAVSLAVALVNLFAAQLVKQHASTEAG